ncbi:lipopolysaccharide biosynthesis protein [Chryseobacterium daecheongense]|uniref:lipopolysaccharide biosynthesis protein n=1 Tax=Chryseobacterium daecheongense TaxID=192389 RepID=UPI001FD67AC1|nr:lipopolysaccharide biosynthesis protein [Chryseobacterium daecheongense]UOU96720.1 lipopolysaccharide biosynthesis protein [Chryseobacterium daecheongense]
MISQNKLYKGLIWSTIEKILIVAVQILIEIVLARFVSPKEYGIMGMLLIIISLSQVLVDSGLGSALIFKKDRSEIDFSTAFYASLAIGLFTYLLIFILAPYIAVFFKSDIVAYIRIISFTIIIGSTSIIYKTKLNIELDFKSQAKFSFFAILISGVVGLVLAIGNFGVWALVVQNILFSFLTLIFLIVNIGWYPKIVFSFQHFKSLFRYSSKLLYAGIFNAVYINLNSLLLGKFFPAKQLGYYTKSYQFTIFPASVFTNVIQRVLFPYYTESQTDKSRLYDNTLKFNKIIFILMMPIISIIILYAHPIIVLLLSDSWKSMVMPFQILLGAILFYPLIVLNMNVFQVLGETSRYFWIEVITKLLGIVILVLLYPYGINGICIGIFVQFFFQYLITSFFVGNITGQNFFRSFNIILYLVIGGVFLFGLFKFRHPALIYDVLLIFVVIIFYSLFLFIILKKEITFIYQKLLKK